jgi:Helix-turn-helix domain
VSYQAVSEILAACEPKGIPRLVLLVIAECANKAGVCWPSMATIAKRAAISVRHAKRVVHALARSGHISIERGNGVSHPNRYRLLSTDTPVTFNPPQTVTQESALRDDQTVTESVQTVTQRVRNGDTAMSPKPSEPLKNLQRGDVELPFEDLVAHFEPLFPHLNVRGSLSKMVFQEKWAPTVSNGNHWLSIERGWRKKKPARKISAPECVHSEPEIQPGDGSYLVPGSPEAIAEWAEAKRALFKTEEV